MTSAQVAAAFARRNEIYEALHPETVQGGDQKSSRQNGDLKREGRERVISRATWPSSGNLDMTLGRSMTPPARPCGVQSVEMVCGRKPCFIAPLGLLPGDVRVAATYFPALLSSHGTDPCWKVESERREAFYHHFTGYSLSTFHSASRQGFILETARATYFTPLFRRKIPIDSVG